MSNYKIVKVQLPIVGFRYGHGIAGHNFVAMLDENNQVVRELHGLATRAKCDENGNPVVKPVGILLSDTLKVHHIKGPYHYNIDFPQQIVFEGSKEEVEAKWNAGLRALVEINRNNEPYPPFGIFDIKRTPLDGPENSNSVASTLLRAMELEDPDLGWRLTPGEGKQLLNSEELNKVQNDSVVPTDDEIRENLCVPQFPLEKSEQPNLNEGKPVSSAENMANRLLAMYMGQSNETLSSVVDKHEYTGQRNTEVAQLAEQQKQTQAQEFAQKQEVEEPIRAIRRV